jgi:O-acetyl-ADP-ribose deacetylase (regulator of RNase III)
VNLGIRYVEGDATAPDGLPRPTLIAHGCNTEGGWGAGFVLAVSRRWPEPEAQYRAWVRREGPGAHLLGRIQPVSVARGILVVNMVTQEGTIPRGGLRPGKEPPIRYSAVERCLQDLTNLALGIGASVAMPQIGAGLAGGDWNVIEGLVESTLVRAGVPVTVYLFNPGGG